MVPEKTYWLFENNMTKPEAEKEVKISEFESKGWKLPSSLPAQ